MYDFLRTVIFVFVFIYLAKSLDCSVSELADMF